MLLGTDLQTLLGFALVVNKKLDLLTGKPYPNARKESKTAASMDEPRVQGTHNTGPETQQEMPVKEAQGARY